MCWFLEQNGLRGGPQLIFPLLAQSGCVPVRSRTENECGFFADAILVIKCSLNQQITSICCCPIYKYNDVSVKTETSTQDDSREQGVPFIYIHLCRRNIGL